MKLYTESEIRSILEDIGTLTTDAIDWYINEATHIELPSEEEIEGACNEELNGLLSTFGFRKGAKWVIEQIKQQNNGK